MDTPISTRRPVTVGTIGHVDHGKTTLTAAIATVLSKKFGGEAIAYEPRELEVGDTVRFNNPDHPDLVGISGVIDAFANGGRSARLTSGRQFGVRNLEKVRVPEQKLAPAPPVVSEAVTSYLESIQKTVPADPVEPEYTGGSVNYYRVPVDVPTTEGAKPYTAECNDIIEALQMTYAEGNAFKAIWRMCAARQGLSKKGYTDGLYDAEKVVFFGERLVEKHKTAQK